MSSAAGALGFLRDGYGELRRGVDRLLLQQKLRQNNWERDAALTALGAKAWEDKLDLSAFAEVRDRLQGVAARSGKLTTAAEQLNAQKTALENERRDKRDGFKARRDAVESKRRPAADALQAARARYDTARGESAKDRARIAAIATELASGKPAGGEASPGGAAPAETAEQRHARLTAEQNALTEKATALEAELPGLASKAAELQDEVARHTADIAAIDAEQKDTLARLDSEIARLKGELQAAGKEQREAGKEQTGLYRELGAALFAAGNFPASLEEPVKRVSAADAARAELDSRLEALRLQSGALPAGTMPKFWGAVIGGPLLAIVLVFGVSAAFQSAPTGPVPANNLSQGTANDPEGQKDQTVQRFIQAGARSDSQTRASAVQILRDDILTLGATADPAQLPNLAKILHSKEPELREAAANAMGMIRPTASETKALADLLQDRAEPVSRAAHRALEASRDPAAHDILAKADAGK